MNTLEQTIVAMVEQQALAHVISGERMAHPDLSGDALVDATLGDVKHWLRGRISFLADIVWPSVQASIRSAVTAEMALESGGATS